MLMWKRKKNSKLLIVEMFISFLLLFALSVILVKNASNYLKPIGFEYENIWVLDINFNTELNNEEEIVARRELFHLIIKEIKAIPDVVNLTNCTSNFPYDMSVFSSGIRFNDKHANSNRVNTDVTFAEVMHLEVQEGRWFSNNDVGQKEIPIVINSVLKGILFEDEPAINKVIDSGMFKVVGIVENYKIKGEFAEHTPTYFTMMKPEEYSNVILIKSKPETGEEFEAQLISRTSTLAKDWTITIKKLSDYRNDMFKLTWIPFIIISAISGFLIINILLGLLGSLWYNINHRKSEIGLRKSVGAPANKIIQQFTCEMLVLATLGVVPGLVIAVQFPLLKAFGVEAKVYVLAMLAAALLIYILVVLCALLPSAQAAKIQSAMALHEE